VSRPFCFDVLGDGSAVLTLRSACLQTTARQAHRELTIALLEQDAAPNQWQTLVNTLERFLSTTDFAWLRAEHPELAGATGCRVRLFRTQSGDASWELLQSS
jgi:hypothetical protein